MLKRIHIKVPATSANLGPGFDVLGVALHLFNEVTFIAGMGASRKPSTITLEISGEGAAQLPTNESNLVIVAAYRVFEKTKEWPRHLQVKMVNRIPLGRGLGSSASAIVAGLYAANQLCHHRLNLQALLDMAVSLEGHPDNVVPAMVGGFCVAGVMDQGTKYLKFSVPTPLRAVICSPLKPLATPASRRVLPSRIPLSAAVFSSSRTAFLIGSILQKRYEWLGFAMDDVLHQPPRAAIIPGLMSVIGAAKEAGAYGAALSGAGPSVIALTRPGPTIHRIGEAMQKQFAAHGVQSRWFETTLENRGVR